MENGALVEEKLSEDEDCDQAQRECGLEELLTEAVSVTERK